MILLDFQINTYSRGRLSMLQYLAAVQEHPHGQAPTSWLTATLAPPRHTRIWERTRGRVRKSAAENILPLRVVPHVHTSISVSNAVTDSLILSIFILSSNSSPITIVEPMMPCCPAAKDQSVLTMWPKLLCLTIPGAVCSLLI